MTDDQYNEAFSRLNPDVPINKRWSARSQREYLERLIRPGGQYKDPMTEVDVQTQPLPAPTPAPIQTPTSNSDLESLLFNAKVMVNQIEALIAKR